MENTGENRPRRQRTGLFWPILLIVLGVVFLLNNTGMMTGELWGNILRFWPVVFIALALDNLFKREGVVGSALTIGLATAFLLSNFGLLNLNMWGVLMRIWPLFLVAFGFDVLIGRRSWLMSLAGAVVILAILAGALYLMGVNVQAGQRVGTEIRQELESDITAADINLELAAGTLRLKKMVEPVALIMGKVPDEKRLPVKENYSASGVRASYELRNADSSLAMSGNLSPDYTWDLELTGQIPLDLSVAMGAGDQKLDLSGLKLSGLKVDLAAGKVEIILPATSSFSAEIENAVGDVTIIIPSGVEVVIEVDNALSVVQSGSGIIKSDDIYTTGGGGAEFRITLRISQAVGTIILKRQ